MGTKPNTAFISTLGSDVLAKNGTVKIKPTFELQSHPGIFAAGDIIEWNEQKQAGKAASHISVVVPNVLSFLAKQPQTKEYKGSLEMIVIPVGKVRCRVPAPYDSYSSGCRLYQDYGAGYFDVWWGIVLGSWFARMVKGKTLFVPKIRSDRGL